MFFYGKYTSAYLLINYGFCYRDNKYDQVDVQLEMRPESNVPEHIVCFDTLKTQDIQIVNLKADRLNSTLLCYLRLLIQTETMFQGDAAEGDREAEGSAASTNTSVTSSDAGPAQLMQDDD